MWKQNDQSIYLTQVKWLKCPPVRKGNQPWEVALAVPVEAYLKAWGAVVTHEYGHPVNVFRSN